MDHQEAVRTEAVEKYLLNELTPPERDEFEEHLFGCAECAADLKTAVAFLDAAKKELRRRHTARVTRGTPGDRPRHWLAFLWRPAFVAPAFAVLLGIILLQDLAILPRGGGGNLESMPEPEVLAAVSLIGAGSRGGDVPTVAAGKNQSLLLSVDIPAIGDYPAYACLLMSPAGATVWSVPVTPEQAKDTVFIRVPPRDWQSGSYTLIVQGLSKSTARQVAELARYRFELSHERPASP